MKCDDQCLSVQDILTDFTVEPERIPVEDGDLSWFGHKVLNTHILSKKEKNLSLANFDFFKIVSLSNEKRQ